MTHDDEKLQTLFDQMRQADAQHAPDFHSLVSAPERAVSFKVRWVPVVFASATSLAVICFAALLSLRQPDQVAVAPGKTSVPGMRSETSLTQWEASSDALISETQLSMLTSFSAPTDSLLTSWNTGDSSNSD